MATYTTGQRQQINRQAKTKYTALRQRLNLYKTARLEITRRQERRRVETLLGESDRILRSAEAVGLRSTDVSNLSSKDTEARRALGKPARTPATASAAAATPARPAARPGAVATPPPAATRRPPTATRRPAATRPRTTAPRITPKTLLPATPVFPPTTQDVAPVPQLQGAMDRLIQQRDQYINMVANGQMSAAQAENALVNMLNSAEGSAIMAQDQAAAQAWLQDASNALYQNEANYQQQAYAQQAEPAVEYVYEDGAPASPEDAAEEPSEEPSDDSDEAIQNEYEAGYPGGGVEGLMGLGATRGESRQVSEQAKAIRLFLKAELPLYKRALTDFVRRQHRRKLEEGVSRAEPVIARARSMGVRGGQVEDLFKKVREVNEALGRPTQPVAPPTQPQQRVVPPVAARAVQQQAARAQAQLRAARARLASQDRRLAAVPHLQSPSGQTSVRALVEYRNNLQQQVAAGAMTAAQAKTELAVAITTGAGSAVAAQDRAGATEWQKSSEVALEKTEQAAVETETAAAIVVETPVAEMAETSKKGMLPALVGGLAGAGIGYMVAEKEDDQITYAAVGGVVGLILGCIVKRAMKKREEPVAAQPASAQADPRRAATLAAIGRLPSMPPALRRMLTEGSFTAGTDGMKYGDGTPVAPADEASINQYVAGLTDAQQELYGQIMFGNV